MLKKKIKLKDFYWRITKANKDPLMEAIILNKIYLHLNER